MADKVSNALSISAYMVCGLCVEEIKAGKAPGLSPAECSQLSVGLTREGLQVWCRRHDCNVMHIDFEGHTHPAVTTRGAKP